MTGPRALRVVGYSREKMPREDAATKARRLLVEGRLIVTVSGNGTIVASCRGDSARIYTVGFNGREWHCDCEAIGRCSHILATQLVTVEP